VLWASFGSLSVVPWILFAQSSWNMDTTPGTLAASRAFEARPEIQDRAEVFDLKAARQSIETSRQLNRKAQMPIRIETVRSLDGAWIADVARRKARSARAGQLYILVAADERDVGVISARQGLASRLSDQDRGRIRRAFLGPIQVGEFDQALEQGVRTIATTLESARVAQPVFDRQDAVILTAILVVLAIYPLSRIWEWSRSRGQAAPDADPLGVVGDTSSNSDPMPAARIVPAIVIDPLPPANRRRRKMVEAN
jgi:uncharacterized membrane protein YgcG